MKKIRQGTQKGVTHPYQTVPGLKLPLCLLAVINQREARAPATTKVCLESERNDAGLVDLVDPGELFGHVGSGDRGSRRVEHINDKLTAGKEAVCGEFPSTDCNRGRVILGRGKVSEHPSSVHGHQHPDTGRSIQRIRHGFTHNPTRIPVSMPSMSSTEQHSLPWYRPAMC